MGDYSNYAGLIIIGIFLFVLFMIIIAIKIGKSVPAVIALSVIGMWLGIIIVDLFDFKDATLETVITITSTTITPSIIYIFNGLRRFIRQRREIRSNQQRIEMISKYIAERNQYLTEIEKIEQWESNFGSMNNLITLVKTCCTKSGQESMFFENAALKVLMEKWEESRNNKSNFKLKINKINTNIDKLQMCKDFPN